MLNHGVIFNLGSVKVCSPAVIQTYFIYDKDKWIAVTDYCMYFHLIVVSFGSYTLINTFYSFISFSFLTMLSSCY